MIDFKKFAAFGAVFVMIAVAFAGIFSVSDDSDAATPIVTQGDTLTLEWKNYEAEAEGMDASVGDEVAYTSILGSSKYLSPATSGNQARFVIPYDMPAGTYTYIQSLYSEESQEELAFYTQTFTVTGQYGTADNPYSASSLESQNSIFATDKTTTVYVCYGTEIDITVYSSSTPEFTCTSGAGLTCTQGSSARYGVITGTLTGNFTLTCKPALTSSTGYYTLNLVCMGQPEPNTLTASGPSSTQWAKSGTAVSYSLTVEANNDASVSYAVKSCTLGSAFVSSGKVTYLATVNSTTTATVVITVTATFADGNTLSQDVSTSITVDPIFAFTNAVTSGSLSVKGTGA